MKQLRTVDGRKPEPIYAGALGFVRRAIDGAVSTVAPGLGHRMRQARLRSSALLAYEAARITRTQPKPSSGSADSEILGDLKTLRDGSRTMVRDDAHAASAVRVLEENVVGKGMVPQCVCTAEATGMTEEETERWRRDCEGEWTRWSEQADATGYGTFSDLQRIVVRSLMADGEAIAHAVVEGSDVWVELIDPDRLESPGYTDTDKLRGGVELGNRGQPVAYHILPQHPADHFVGRRYGVQPTRIPQTDGRYSVVQHVFRRDRPGQTRGVPWLAPALPYNAHLHHYLNSELIAARVTSSVAMFVKRAPESNDPNIQPVSPQETGGGIESYHESIEPGTIEYLNEGEEIQPFLPTRPGTQFEPFVKRILRAIWAAPGLAYELVAKDFGSMNYSSARALLNECRRSFDATRVMVARQFCAPWWENVILAAIAGGRLRPPVGFLRNPKPFLAQRWVAPSYGWIDPTKEIEASRMAVEANLSTPYDEAAKAGFDAEEVVRARARFLKFTHEQEELAGLDRGTLTAERAERIETVQGGTGKAPAGGGGAPPAPAGDESAEEEDSDTEE